MKWMLDLKFEKPNRQIHHSEPLLLMGSCFTGNIGVALEKRFFQTVINPCGIIFDPASLSRHIHRAIQDEEIDSSTLIYYNERYQSLQFHSDFSAMDAETAKANMQTSMQILRHALSNSKHLILTLGSSFVYRYKETNECVANCHQFPADQFEKVLLKADEITAMLQETLNEIRTLNPEMNIIFTVSPVRHARDGVVANNRSKAQLIEAVSRLTEANDDCYYFPAYEWVIDVLRDYRWYDLDLVHPNYPATDSVFEQFCAACLDEWTRNQLKDLHQLSLAMEHRPRFKETTAHRKFLESTELKREEILKRMPWLKK